MFRTYTVSTTNVSVSAAQDLALILGATGKMCRLRRVECGATNTTAPTSQQLSFRCRFLPATVTAGSGGTTPTPQKNDPGNAAASFTAHANDTTPASTNSTAVLLWSGTANVLAGLDYSFLEPPLIGPSEAVTFELLSTVTGTVNLSITVTVEEMGG